MDPEYLLAQAGNLLALLVLGWKTSYDLYWNSKRFQRELDEGLEALEAASRKRSRNEFTTAIAFLFLAFSNIALITGGAMGKKAAEEETGLEMLHERMGKIESLLGTMFVDFSKRIQDIERHVYSNAGPPGTSGGGAMPIEDQIHLLDRGLEEDDGSQQPQH